MSDGNKVSSLVATYPNLEKVRQHLEALKKQVGPMRELTPEEQDAFETKFSNSVRMKRWVENPPSDYIKGTENDSV